MVDPALITTAENADAFIRDRADDFEIVYILTHGSRPLPLPDGTTFIVSGAIEMSVSRHSVVLNSVALEAVLNSPRVRKLAIPFHLSDARIQR